MYKITCIDTKHFHVGDNADLERFRFVPHIETKSKYLKDDQTEALLEVEYKLECHFEDVLKDKLVFASVTCQFVVSKNDSDDFEHKSETTFKCVKTVESKFQEFLSSKKHGVTLFGIGIRPITLESWQKGNPNNGVGGFLN